jgi:hypothetical protein
VAVPGPAFYNSTGPVGNSTGACSSNQIQVVPGSDNELLLNITGESSEVVNQVGPFVYTLGPSSTFLGGAGGNNLDLCKKVKFLPKEHSSDSQLQPTIT